MIIYFVRHGHPDYEKDCLTPLGMQQAQKVADRLRASGIERIFASTRGRALETAQYTADVLNLPVIPCDFMQELYWHSINGEEILADGHPWFVAEILASRGISLADPDWCRMDPYCKSRVVQTVDSVIEGFDALLAELGYEREGEYYRVTGDDTDKKIAIFSHAGSSSAAISHLLNITFPQACGSIHMDFTSITKFSFPNEKGQLICPKLIGLNDAEHIQGITVDNVFC